MCTPRSSSTCRIALTIGLLMLAFTTQPATAGVAYFAAPTDTIQVEGNSLADVAFTIEARVRRLTCGPVSGRVYAEQANGLEDKTLYVLENTIGAGAWTDPSYTTIQAATQLIAGRWYHLAFVRDGDEERLYLDGELQAQRPVTAPISNTESSVRTLGAFQYIGAGAVSSAAGCQVDFVRVSNTARYGGSSFAPPSESELVADSSTQLLYFFDEPSGSPVVQDASAGDHSGLVGVGNFPSATAPMLGAEAQCTPDLDGSCVVGFGDLTRLLNGWGDCASECSADLDGSGTVGFNDLTMLLVAWGPCFP